MLIPNWTYDGDDPGLKLFTLANAKLPELHASRPFVYEIGCHDTDWIERTRKLQPSWYVSGMDWRKQQRGGVDCGDVLTSPLPYASAFIGISSIEHVGLGHYDGDPQDYFGDIKTVQRLRDHLHRDGCIYLDVPYAPEGYWVKGSKCRVYDDRSLTERFGPHDVIGYTTPAVDGWIDKPARNYDDERLPFYYVALAVRKDAQKS